VTASGLFLSEGDSWLRQRRPLQPAFHRDRMGAHGDTMVQAANAVAAVIPARARLSAWSSRTDYRSCERRAGELTRGSGLSLA
jgi:cytochrome P450